MKSNVSTWLFRSRKKDGSYYPKWRYRYIGPDGKRRYGTGFTDKRETERLAQQMAMQADEIRRGIRKPPLLSDTESLKPINELVRDYLEWGKSQGGRANRPWSKDHFRKKDSFLKWWVEELGIRTLRDIELSKVEKVLQILADRGASGKTLQNRSEVLKSFISWCQERKKLDVDPLEGLRPFNVSPKEPRRPLTLEEIGKLLNSAQPGRRLIYQVALVTGIRLGEIQSLRVGDLDAENCRLHLQASAAKDRREAFFPIPRPLATDLSRVTAGKSLEAPLLVGFTARPDKDFNKDLKIAGIAKKAFGGKVSFHSLRHTFVQLGVESRIDPKTVQEMARHKSADLTLGVYAHLNSERMRDAVEQLGELIRGAEEQNSQIRVKREPVAMAAGAEGFTQPIDAQAADDESPEVILDRFDSPRLHFDSRSFVGALAQCGHHFLREEKCPERGTK